MRRQQEDLHSGYLLGRHFARFDDAQQVALRFCQRRARNLRVGPSPGLY